MSSASVEQLKLQKQSNKILKKLELLELLSKYGRPHIIGSLKLGLMTWRDIDIEMIVNKLNKDLITEIVSALIKQPHKRMDFAVTDNRDKDRTPMTPIGIYLGLKIFGDDIKPHERFGTSEKVWKIDIHFVLRKDSQAIQKTEELERKLTEENRKIILEIKEKVTKSPKHRKEIFSMDVYKAVLDEGVSDLKGFQTYLKQLGKEL